MSTRSVCPTERKPRYTTEAVALEHLANHDVEDQPRLKAYECQCGSWHLASTDVFLLRAAGPNRTGGERRWSVVRLNDGSAVLTISTSSPRHPRVKKLKLEVDTESARELAEALLKAVGAEL